MGAVREEPWENNLEGMAASISASVPGCQDSCPRSEQLPKSSTAEVWEEVKVAE